MNKVVVHTGSGEIIRGYTGDFSGSKPFFTLSTTEENISTNQKIPLNGLKAVFFVRSFQGNFLHKTLHTFADSPGYGRRVMLKFRDGERFYGRVEVMRQEDPGFFIHPLDGDSNTVRAFVLRDFIESVHFID
jgi:hypothetical protein